MAKKQAIDINTLNELAVSVKKIGIERTRHVLNSAKNDSVRCIVDLLINDTASQLLISKNRIFAKQKGGRRITAIAIIVYLMRKYLVDSYKLIYIYIPELNVIPQRLSQLVNYIQNLSDKVKCDKEVIDNMFAIEQKLKMNIELFKENDNN